MEMLSVIIKKEGPEYGIVINTTYPPLCRSALNGPGGGGDGMVKINAIKRAYTCPHTHTGLARKDPERRKYD